MVDYHLLRSNNWKLPNPEPEQEEAQEGQHPLVMDFLYNTHTDRSGKIIALKVSLQLPLNACRCSHCDAIASFPRRSCTDKRQEA
jgi:hypothetical protein